MIDRRTKQNFQTGWLFWKEVEVTLVNANSLHCRASVVNLSDQYPRGVVCVKLQGSSAIEYSFEFEIRPNDRETIHLEKKFSSGFTGIVEILADEM